MRYSRQARHDILDIWLQIAASRPLSADRTIDHIRARCRGLEDVPHSGPPRPELFPDAPALVIDRWLAIYQIDSRGPQIVRVVDGARDLGKLAYPRD